MSYSRRELYAMGEPFGECATERKVDGRYLCGLGSSPSTPKNTTQTVTQELPKWAQPYAKESLAKASALADAPYQTYSGERIAQFSPLQQQAFGRAEGQQVAGQIGFGTGLAGLAGTSSFGDQGTAASFMSPYMQQVVDQQMSSAQRQADIAGTQRGAQAVRAGAFGGSRQAIENAEAARALASQKGEIQAKGLQSAFERAQQQFNQEQATRLNAAQALGQLGQQQFGQEMGITGQQAEFGAQQRAATQDILSQQYQDFLNQQRAPYDQLAFMTSMIRGTPMGGTTAQYQSQAAPSTTSQLVGLGTAAAGAYGASQGSAKGGEVKSYAAGGIASLLDDVDSLSDEQLAQMQQGEQRPLTAAAVAEEIMRRQAMREDGAQQQAMMAQAPQTTVAEEELAGLPGLPAPNLEGMGDEYTAAGGGIVAFQNRGEVPQVGDQYDAAKQAYQQSLENLRRYGGRQKLADPAGYAAAESAVRQAEQALESAKSSWNSASQGMAAPVASRSQIGQGVNPALVASTPVSAPVAAQTPAAAAMQGGGTGRRAGMEDPRLQASTVSAMVKALEKPAAPTTKEKVDRETTAGPGGLPQLKGMQAATTGGLSDLRTKVEDINKARTEAATAALERTKKGQEEDGVVGAEREKRLKAQEEGLKGAEDKNFNMALIEAGLAMMSGTSANAFENIGKGALVGTAAYTKGVERIQSKREKLDDALAQLDELRYGEKKANRKELNAAQERVERAAIENEEALYNYGSKALDMSREDAKFAVQTHLQQQQIAASNKTSFEERMVMALGKGDMAAGYKALKAMDAKPADLMGEYNDFLKANPMLATGDQAAAINAFMRSKIALSGLGAAPRASSTAAGPVRD
jgi:hypothetical protein